MNFSIAMCTYNGEKYLKGQLDSILEQTYLPKELVVCDDCSKDATIAILNEFSKTAPFDVHIYINEQNLGYVKNFEKACLKTKYEYVVFCDHDDVWKKNKLEKLKNYFIENDNAELIFTDATLFGEVNTHKTLWEENGFVKKRRQRYNLNHFSFLLNHWIVTGATMVCKRSLINSAVPFPKKFVHDEWLALMSARKGTLLEVDEKLTNYRIHSSQQIGVSSKRKKSSNLSYKNGLEISIKKMDVLIDKIKQDPINLEKDCNDIKTIMEYKNYFEQRLKIANKNIIARLFLSFIALSNGTLSRFTENPFRAFVACIIKH